MGDELHRVTFHELNLIAIVLLEREKEAKQMERAASSGRK